MGYSKRSWRSYMSKKMGFSKGSKLIPIATGLLLLLLVSLILSRNPMEVRAAELYDVQGLTAEKIAQPVNITLTNGTAITDMDVIHVTADIASPPNSTDDVLVLTILVNESNGSPRMNIKWNLAYTGSGTTYQGNITINETLQTGHSSDGENLSIKGYDGDNISIKRYLTSDPPLIFLTVDVDGPSVTPVEPSSAFVTYQDTNYVKTGSTLNFTFSDFDPLTTYDWLITNNKITYQWTGGTGGTYNGTPLSIPQGQGAHEITVNVTDRFDQKTSWSKNYTIAEFLNSVQAVNTTLPTFSSQTIFIGDQMIEAEGSVRLSSCEIVFLEDGDNLHVMNEGSLIITGSDIYSTGGLFTISSQSGATLTIRDTEITVPSSVPSHSSTLKINSGTLDNITVNNLTNRIWIGKGRVDLKNSNIDVDDDGSIYVDTSHKWEADGINILGTTINGTSNNPIRINNTAVWKPYDLDEMYYSDIREVGSSFKFNTTGLTDPFIWIPHFLHSESALDHFDVSYNNSGTWDSLAGFPKSNMIYDEWSNGEDAKIDLSHLPEGVIEIRMNWTAASDNKSCVYVGEPMAGADGIEMLEIGDDGFEGVFEDWLPGKVTGPFLKISGVSIEDAALSFIHVESSGEVELSELELGNADDDHLPSTHITSVNSSISIKGTNFTCNENTIMTYYQHFSAGNDWATSWFMTSNMTSTTGNNCTYGIMSEGGLLHISNTTVKRTVNGIHAKDGMVSLDNVDIESNKKGYWAELPSEYPADPNLVLKDVDMRFDWEEAGIGLTGTPEDYDLVLDIDLDTESQATILGINRNDGLGALVIDIRGDTSPTANLLVTVRDSPRHGICILNWPEDGMIKVTSDSQIRGAALDGVYLGSGIDIELHANLIRDSNGYALYAGDDNIIDIKTISTGIVYNRNREGGIMAGDDNILTIDDASIHNSDSGWAVLLGTNAVLNITDLDILTCGGGLYIDNGAMANLTGITINGTYNERGIEAKGSTIYIQKGDAWSEIYNTRSDGILLDNCQVYIDQVRIHDNEGTGLKLWNTRVHNIFDCRIYDNGIDGIYFYVGTETVLGPNNTYLDIREVNLEGNTGAGLTGTVDPSSVSSPIEITLRSIIIGGNTGGDIMTPSEVHITWEADTPSSSTRDIIGSELVNGRIRANMDISVGEGISANIVNENITLLGNGRSIKVMNSGFIGLKNCYIRPNNPSYRFSIIGETGSSVNIEGGFLGQLYRLEMDGGNSFNMDGTLVKNSEGPIYLKDTPFDVYDSEFSGIDGSAIIISGGEGKIVDSKFSGNTIGVRVEDLDGDFKVMGSEFTGNNWGLYLFRSSDNYVNITDCKFSNNSPAPIWTGAADANVIDSIIDPDKVAVTEDGQLVLIGYTLELQLIDEEENRVTFDLELDMGPGTIRTDEGLPGSYEEVLQVFRVQEDGVIDLGENIYLTITYIEGREDGKDKKGEIEDHFVLNTKRSITYYGYKSPIRKINPGTLEAQEDKGLKTGTVDVSAWFDDIGNDPGNLTFTAGSSMPQIMPKIEGDLLSLSLKENWNGIGNISVTATDPHGKSLTITVTINVLPINDPPVITNPVILVKNSATPTTPRTGDTLMAVWEWYDIDGDEPPRTPRIRWFLNGKYQPDYDGNKEINNVFSGQIWNYTVVPYDTLDYNFDNPAHSPPVMVGNLPPTLSSVSITTGNPTTLTDLIAEPRGGNDTETGAVIYNYLWEKRVNSNWIPLGAPNSPILDHRYTNKNDDIRVSCWVSDGIDVSGIRTSLVSIRNSAPYVSGAVMNPAVVDENTNMIYLTGITWGDPDGDVVTLQYDWMVGGIEVEISKSLPQILKTQGGWVYPSNITVGITPEDSQGLTGATYFISVDITPTDTDGDGRYDDANGNGRNDPADDKDDDNDGYQDDWEEFLGTETKNYLSTPKDSDNDGQPDGDPTNSKDWMDLDDDNDGVWDIHPDNTNMNNPKWFDTYPFTPGLPGDMDYDGIGDDQDPDRDGDGALNEDDAYPDDPARSSEKEFRQNFVFQIFTLILLILVIIVIGLLAFFIYNGTIKLPSQGPPAIEGSTEAIYDSDDDSPKVAKLPPKGDEAVEEMQEVENMRICSSCGEIVTLGDEICPNCGAMFEVEEEEEEDEELSFDDDDEE